MDTEDDKHPTPDEVPSPLFEPEAAPSSVPNSAAPTVPIATVAPEIIEIPDLPEDGEHAAVTSPFIRRLRVIESDVKTQISTWSTDVNLKAQAAVPTPVSGMKRKASEMTGDSENDDDGDTDDEEDDRVPAYDPDAQSRPRLPIYHPGFKVTEQAAVDIMSTVNQYVARSIKNGYKDKEAHILRAELSKHKTIPYQETVRLTVAGDTGAGKSALLNAILGVLNLNIESDAGNACTCVITEFQRAPASQTKAFAASVHLFDLKICQKLVTDLFKQWYGVKQKQRSDPDEVDDKDLNQMKTARDCLHQMFAHQLESGTIEQFMSDAASCNDRIILKKLSTWTVDMHQLFIPEGERAVMFESSTPENLIEQYHPFTREVANASFRGKPLTCSPWPLVQRVRVYIKSPILEEKVVIADVPGGSDVNYFRTSTASQYLQTCDMTIVVAKIDRIADDSSFRTLYMEAYRRRRTGSVILVATKSDILNDEISSTVSLDLATEEQLTIVAQEVASIEKKIEIIDNDIARNKIEQNTKANKQLKRRKGRLTKRKNAYGKERKDLLITARNKHVSSSLGENYRTDTGDDAGAAVYCVSNLMYARHLRGYDMTDVPTVPTMTQEQTQIPALCSNIYSLPSKGKTSNLDHFVRVTVPGVLSVVQMSVSTTTLARVKHLTTIIKKARDALTISINELENKFRVSDIEQLFIQLSAPSLQEKFDNGAIKKLKEWEDLNANTHRAICNKKGNYIQKKKNMHTNWNEDLLSPVRSQIDIAFRTIIDEACETFQAEASQDSKDIISNLDDTLKNDPKALACGAYDENFKEFVKAFYNSIDKHVGDANKVLKDGLIKVHMHATKLRDGQGDYFPEAMSTIYTTAHGKRGAGRGQTMKLVRCQYLQEAIPGPTGPFTAIARDVKQDAGAAIGEATELLRKKLGRMLAKIQLEFERMKDRKESDTEQGRVFRKELHELVDEARRVLNGVVQQSLDLCKQFK